MIPQGGAGLVAGLEVVVDDGSLDKTEELVKRMARLDRRVRIICHPKGRKSVPLRRGVCEALNKICTIASGPNESSGLKENMCLTKRDSVL